MASVYFEIEAIGDVANFKAWMSAGGGDAQAGEGGGWLCCEAWHDIPGGLGTRGEASGFPPVHRLAALFPSLKFHFWSGIDGGFHDEWLFEGDRQECVNLFFEGHKDEPNAVFVKNGVQVAPLPWQTDGSEPANGSFNSRDEGTGRDSHD